MGACALGSDDAATSAATHHDAGQTYLVAHDIFKKFVSASFDKMTRKEHFAIIGQGRAADTL